MVSINSFGVGGTNVHVILRANEKEAQTVSLPTLEIPRLVFLSGRTRDTLTEQFETVSFIRLFIIYYSIERTIIYLYACLINNIHRILHTCYIRYLKTIYCKYT